LEESMKFVQLHLKVITFPIFLRTVAIIFLHLSMGWTKHKFWQQILALKLNLLGMYANKQ